MILPDATKGGVTEVFVAWGRVWAVTVLNRGPAAVAIDGDDPGRLDAGNVVELGPVGGAVDPVTSSSPRFVAFGPDLYRLALGTLLRIDGTDRSIEELAGPEAMPEVGDLRLYAGETELGLVSIEGDRIHVGRLDDDDRLQWWEDPVTVDDPDAATIVAAGDWLTILTPGDRALSIELGTGRRLSHPHPLAGLANPNAVWTGAELVVWGGQGTPTVDGGVVAARWTPPGPSSTSAPSAEGDAGPGDLESAIGALPLAERVDWEAIDRGVGDAVTTEEGVWVYTRPDAGAATPVGTHGEILLLESRDGPILHSWFLPLQPAGFLAVGPDAVYCARPGDGGLPDSLVCRIDRTSLELRARVWPAEVVDDVYAERGWTVGSPGWDRVSRRRCVRSPGRTRGWWWSATDAGSSSTRTNCARFVPSRCPPAPRRPPVSWPAATRPSPSPPRTSRVAPGPTAAGR